MTVAASPARFAQIDRGRVISLIALLSGREFGESQAYQAPPLGTCSTHDLGGLEVDAGPVDGRLAAREGQLDEGLSEAAVAVVLCPDSDGLSSFVLTRRSAQLSKHAGQWALPGGRLDSGEGPVNAALRELDEEVGLRLGTESVLGVLDRFVTRSGFNITPVVCFCERVPNFTLNPDEVQSVHLVPLTDLDVPEVPILRAIPESDRLVLSLPMRGQRIHAPTAAIIYQFFELVFRSNLVKVAHFEQPVFAWQ